MKPLTIAITVNPNSGETTLFKLFIGSREIIVTGRGMTVGKNRNI